MNMQYRRYQRACEQYDALDAAGRTRVGAHVPGIDAWPVDSSAAVVASQLFPSIWAFVETVELALKLPEVRS